MKTSALIMLICGALAAEEVVLDARPADSPVLVRQAGPFGRVPLTGEPGPYVLGGYVDTVFGAVAEEGPESGSNRLSGFSAVAGLDGMVRLIPEAVGVVSLTASTRAEESFAVDQAYVRFERAQGYLRLGRTYQWFGWERFNAPELWRINKSYTYYNSGSLDGGTLGWRFTPEWRAEFSVANEIITPRQESQGKTGTDLGYGAKLRWEPGDGRTWDLTAFIDKATAEDAANGGYGDVAVVSTWGEWRHIAGSPWSAAMDVAYADNPDGNQLFALATLRIDGKLGWPGFATLMATWLEEDYDTGAIEAAAGKQLNLFSNKRLEVALAAFGYPTGDYRYRLGVEVRALDSTVDGEDEVSAHISALALLP